MLLRKTATLVILLSATITTQAQERKLTGEEIIDLLPKIETKGQSYTQTFTEKGLTSYVHDGRPSEGRWMVQDNQYCSTWPPNDIIECYDVLADTDKKTITWIGAKNAISKSTYRFLEN